MTDKQDDESRLYSDGKYRGVVIFPPEPIVMPPPGTWRRLPDGQIEANLSLSQLRQMVAIKRRIEVRSEVEEEVVRSVKN